MTALIHPRVEEREREIFAKLCSLSLARCKTRTATEKIPVVSAFHRSIPYLKFSNALDAALVTGIAVLSCLIKLCMK